MNFPLKNLEAHLPENWLIDGEILFESQQVSSLLELERHLWVAHVEEREVEIQISPSRVKAFTCDCAQFKKEKGCAHIAAALLALRKDQQEKESREIAKKPVRKKKTNIYHLLDQIPSEDLIDFVREYARQHRPFALALKARFTGSLPVEDKRAQYLELLDSAINSVRSKSDQVSFQGSRQVLQVVRELLGQVEEAITERHLQEATTLLTLILEKIGPIARKTAGKDNKFEKTIRKGFQHFNQLLLQNPAPDLLQTIWDFSLRESRKFTYRKSLIQQDYFRLLAQVCPLLGRTSELLDHFQQSRKEMEPDDPNRAELLLLIHKLLLNEGDEAKIEAHFLAHLGEPKLVLFAVEEALASGHWKKARFLAEKGLAQTGNHGQLEMLEEHLFQLALQEKDQEAILHFGTARFLRTKKLEYLEYVKAHASRNWPSRVDSLLTQLEKQPYSIPKRDAIAQLLYEEGRFDALSQYISRLQSLDLLQKYGHSWPSDSVKQMEKLYVSTLQNYLKNHLGRKPSQRVRELLEHLFTIGMEDMADRLLLHFRQTFSQRQSLMEELEALPS